MKREADRTVIEQLQALCVQGNRAPSEQQLRLGLGPLENSFPGKVFPRGAIHEFISLSSQQAACTSGFMSVVLGKLMQHNGVCVWVSTKPRRAVFAPALKGFGVLPHRVLFVDTGPVGARSVLRHADSDGRFHAGNPEDDPHRRRSPAAAS